MFLFGIFATPLPYVIFFFIYLYGCAFIFPIDIQADTNLLPAIAEVNTVAAADDINSHGLSHAATDALLNTGPGVHYLKAHFHRIFAVHIAYAHPTKHAGPDLPRPPPQGFTTSLFLRY